MSSINDSDNVKEDRNGDVTLTVRTLMQGKEVGAIIGRGGDLVRQLRDESGAKIYISDASVPDRIVTVTGTTEAVDKAYNLITTKIQQYFERQHGSISGAAPPLSFKLIVPAIQCGSIIGKGGSKIKELRDKSGASIQVSSEMLPNSTERTVTIVGYAENVTQCIYHVCQILLESPPRGNVIAYNPHKVAQNSLLAGLQENLGLGDKLNTSNPLASLLSLSGLSGLFSGGINAAAVTAIASSQLRAGNKRSNNVQTVQIMVPNEFIGSIIGKGGSKIAEIRQSSGANIRISANDDTVDSDEGLKRPITITGTLDAITVAKGLINMSVDLQKANLEAQNSSNSDGSQSSTHQSPSPVSSSSSSSTSMPITTILSKPAFNTLSNLTALGGLSELLGTVQNSRPVQTTGVHRPKSYIYRFRNNSSGGSGGGSGSGGEKVKTERNKFAPY